MVGPSGCPLKSNLFLIFSFILFFICSFLHLLEKCRAVKRRVYLRRRYEKKQHVCVNHFILVSHPELIITPPTMRFQSTLVVILLAVILITSYASPAVPSHEEVALTSRTWRKFELKEVLKPTRKPTKAPREKPTRKPTRTPTSLPSVHPTEQPTATVEEQGPFSSGGGRDRYPVNMAATVKPTVSADVQPPRLGAKPWWIFNPLQTPPVWDRYTYIHHSDIIFDIAMGATLRTINDINDTSYDATLPCMYYSFHV